MRIRSRGPEQTRAAGASLAAALPVPGGGLVIGLVGPLGVGKTVFAKGLAEGLGVDPDRVASPSFVIASEYEGRDGRRLAHVDLFRVGSAAELEAAGFLDLLAGDRVVAVEWADRLPEALPADRLEVCIAWEPGREAAPERELCARALGPTSRAALERWEQRQKS